MVPDATSPAAEAAAARALLEGSAAAAPSPPPALPSPLPSPQGASVNGSEKLPAIAPRRGGPARVVRRAAPTKRRPTTSALLPEFEEAADGGAAAADGASPGSHPALPGAVARTVSPRAAVPPLALPSIAPARTRVPSVHEVAAAKEEIKRHAVELGNALERTLSARGSPPASSPGAGAGGADGAAPPDASIASLLAALGAVPASVAPTPAPAPSSRAAAGEEVLAVEPSQLDAGAVPGLPSHRTASELAPTAVPALSTDDAAGPPTGVVPPPPTTSPMPGRATRAVRARGVAPRNPRAEEEGGGTPAAAAAAAVSTLLPLVSPASRTPARVAPQASPTLPGSERPRARRSLVAGAVPAAGSAGSPATTGTRRPAAAPPPSSPGSVTGGGAAAPARPTSAVWRAHAAQARTAMIAASPFAVRVPRRAPHGGGGGRAAVPPDGSEGGALGGGELSSSDLEARLPRMRSPSRSAIGWTGGEAAAGVGGDGGEVPLPLPGTVHTGRLASSQSSRRPRAPARYRAATPAAADPSAGLDDDTYGLVVEDM